MNFIKPLISTYSQSFQYRDLRLRCQHNQHADSHRGRIQSGRKQWTGMQINYLFFSPHPKPQPICNSFALSPHRSLTLPEKTRKQDPRSGNVAYRWFRQLLLSPLKPSSCLCSIFNITAKGWVISEGGTKKIEHGFIRKLWLCIYAITDDRYIQ